MSRKLPETGRACRVLAVMQSATERVLGCIAYICDDPVSDAIQEVTLRNDFLVESSKKGRGDYCSRRCSICVEQVNMDGKSIPLSHRS